MNQAIDHRICFVGDSFIHGTGDPECLGWVGRAAAQARRDGFDLTYYNLGVRRETSADIGRRWERESILRLPDGAQGYLVFSFGVNDTTVENGHPRVDPIRSVQNMLTIARQANSRYPTLIIGPAPIGDSEQNGRIAALDDRYARATTLENIPYLSVFDTLNSDDTWLREVESGDGAHPSAGGYARLAEIVTNWHEWWFRP
ncbi:MAG: lipase [Anaerolineae bacterium]|nr:lipase [Anaerolineae bacterium]